MPDSVADLGEFGLIGELTARLPQGREVLLGPGDDAAVVATPDGRVVTTTDMLVENRHFRRDWSEPDDVGHKAAAQNLADVAAMGARPIAVTVALGVPPDLPAAWALRFADGMRDECAKAGASVVGGDIVRAEMVIVAVTALGDLEGRPAVTRAGARPGDVVGVCGRLGWAEAGFSLLAQGFDEPGEMVAAHRRPDVPYQEGPAAARLGATAMCDVSDGLLADLGHVAHASGVRIDLDPEALEAEGPLREAARVAGGDPLRWALTGGDDNALVATFPRGTALPPPWRAVGAVEKGSGVVVAGRPYRGEPGHEHFSGE